MSNEKQSELEGLGWKERLQTKADLFEFIADCLDEGIYPTNCPEGFDARAGRRFVRMTSKVSRLSWG